MSTVQRESERRVLAADKDTAQGTSGAGSAPAALLKAHEAPLEGHPVGGAWDLDGLDSLCAQTLGDPEIQLAVLDGPVDLTHPCFSGARLEKRETVASGSHSAAGGSDHGTHVCSVIFGQPGSPVRGIAPGCSGLILDVYTQNQDGKLIPCKQRDLARAIEKAVDGGAQVINISGGELSRSGRANRFLEQAILRCVESNILVVAAVGNEGCECTQVPAALPSVLAVGALDAQSHPLRFSNWGRQVRGQGIMAPGENIVGAAPGGATATKTGTSFATPIVAAVAALLVSLQKACGRQPDPLAVGWALLESSTACDPFKDSDCRRLLAGRLNIPGARSLLGLGGSPEDAIRPGSRGRILPAGARGDADCPPSFPVGVETRRATNPSGGARTAPWALPGQRSNSHRQDRPANSTLHIINIESRKERRMSESEPSHGTVQAEAAAGLPSPTPPSSAADSPSGVEPSCSCQAGVQSAEPEGIQPTEAESAPETALALPDAAPPAQALPSQRLSPALRTGLRTSAPSRVQPSFARAPNLSPAIPAPGGGQVLPSECEEHTELVFCLGELGYDFGCEARLDYFVQRLGTISNAFNPTKMSEYLKPNDSLEDTNEADSIALIWTLNIDANPVYAIEPDNQFAIISYALLVRFLYQQYERPAPRESEGGGGEAQVVGQHAPIDEESRLYRIALAGYLDGTKRLYNGTVVPVIRPVVRGMFNWDIERLAQAVGNDSPELRNFLKRIYYELRNLGQSPHDRALNYAGTNAFNASEIFKKAFQAGTRLDKFTVERSPTCRPESDCWDVKFVFFNPKELITAARTVYSYTIDVSDIVPVTVGEVREYHVYLDPRN